MKKLNRVLLSVAAVTLLVAPGALGAQFVTKDPLIGAVDALLEKIYIGIDDVNVACGALTPQEAESLVNNNEFQAAVEDLNGGLETVVESLNTVKHILETQTSEPQNQG